MSHVAWSLWPEGSWLRRHVEHQVYRCYDTQNRLLWVGATNSYRQRISQHRRRTPWWNEVAGIDTTPYPNREEALRAELVAIRTEHPIYNKAGKS